VPKLRDFADDDPKDLLREVVRVFGRDALTTEPRVDQGGIEINQALPRDGVRTIVEPLQ
jgi:hypothetical protein